MFPVKTLTALFCGIPGERVERYHVHVSVSAKEWGEKDQAQREPKKCDWPIRAPHGLERLGECPLNITSETDSVAGDAHTVAILSGISGLLLLICVSDHSVDGLALASVPWLIFIVIDFTVWPQPQRTDGSENEKYLGDQPKYLYCTFEKWRPKCPDIHSNLPALPGVNCFLALLLRMGLEISYPVHLEVQHFNPFPKTEVDAFSFSLLVFTKDSSINLWATGWTTLTWHPTIFLNFLLHWFLGGKIRKLWWTINLFPKSSQWEFVQTLYFGKPILRETSLSSFVSVSIILFCYRSPCIHFLFI